MTSKLDYNVIAEFLSSSTRERIIYELSSPKKRTKALERLSHNAESIIRTEYLYYKGNVIHDAIRLEIKNSVLECIVLSLEYQQGKKMSIEEALSYLLNECDFSIIVDKNWLIIKHEHEGGKGLFYVLRKKQ